MARIVVVDDDSLLRSALRRAFERAGHEVVEADHGGAALAAVAAHIPDLVVTDMTMPLMNGAELIERLRAESATATVSIVAVSGEPPHLARDADAFLLKPVSAKDVLSVVNRLLSRRASDTARSGASD
jgi:two-component system chemotaxis response regulator CheY